MFKSIVLSCVFILKLSAASASNYNSELITANFNEIQKKSDCAEEKYKYKCGCKFLSNCGGLCWAPAYLKFDITTGDESIIKFLDTPPSSEMSCISKLQKFPICN